MNTSMATLGDYVRYFFTGYKTDAMAPGILAVLAAIRNTLLTCLAIVFLNVYDAIQHGTFDLWNWAQWQEYLLPAFMFLLSLLNEWFRKHAYPAVSIQNIPTTLPTATLKEDG